MKKKIISLIAILLLTLTSCYSKRTNIILDGHYYGVNEYNKSVSCDLFVEPISENDYLTSNGKNVIKDEINNNYFSLEFIVHFSEINTQQIDFFNFKDAHNGANGIHVVYKDDNNCWLTPHGTDQDIRYSEMSRYYCIEIHNLELFTYLYVVDE